jgi:beta-lactamase class D
MRTIHALAALLVLAPVAVAPGEPGSLEVFVEPAATGSSALFREAGVEGAFVLLDVGSNRLTIANQELAERRFVPCSTFKIPHTLIGLGTGAIPGPDFALRWDGQRREVERWNRDHTLATAMRDSVVWFYQAIARRIGGERMRLELARLGYGNGAVGERVDRFWLDGPLRISAREQVEFLRRLQAGTLPVRPGDAALVRQLIVLDQGPGFTLRGKTGLGTQDGSAVGWLVGEVENEDARWVYALVVLGSAEAQGRVAAARRPLLERLLSSHGVRIPR